MLPKISFHARNVGESRDWNGTDTSCCLRLSRGKCVMTFVVFECKCYVITLRITSARSDPSKIIASLHVRNNATRYLRRKWLSSPFRFCQVPRVSTTVYFAVADRSVNETSESVASTNSPTLLWIAPCRLATLRHILLQIDLLLTSSSRRNSPPDFGGYLSFIFALPSEIY